MTLLRGLNSREGVKKVVGGGGVGMVDGDGVSMVGERLVGDVSRDALVEKKCEKSTDTGARGVVMVDGVDISSIPLRTLRSRITIIPQVCRYFYQPIKNSFKYFIINSSILFYFQNPQT